MVPVVDILRHLRTCISLEPEAADSVRAFVHDVENGACVVVHPRAKSLLELLNLPGVQAAALFIARCTGRGEYGGSFLHLSANHWTETEVREFQGLEEVYLQSLELPAQMVDIDELETPVSNTAGGLLLCKAGPNWLPIGFLPTDVPTAHALIHLRCAFRISREVLYQLTQEGSMSSESSMISVARQKMLEYKHPARAVMLRAFFDAIARRELVMMGATAEEERVFFQPENGLELEYVFCAQVVATPNGSADFWSADSDLSEEEYGFSHWVKERLNRYLRRRSSILEDDDLDLPVECEQALPEAPVHIGWVIVRHPQDGLQSYLLRHPSLETPFALACLEEAVHEFHRSFP